MNFPLHDHDDDYDEFPPGMPDITELRRKLAKLQVEERRQIVRWAALTCSCPPRYDWYATGPPQCDCSVHGVLAFDPFTGEMI